MFKKITYCIVIVFLLFSCIKKDDFNISRSSTFTPSYSLPVGAFKFDINKELDNYKEAQQILSDSILYNDTLINVPDVIEGIKEYNFSLNNITQDFSNINNLTIRLIFYNGYPTDIYMETVFTDDRNNEIHRIPLPDNIKGADKNKEEYKKSKPMDFEIPENKIDLMGNVKRIFLIYKIYTQNVDQDFVRFYNEYNIKMQIGVRVQLEITP